MLRLGTPSRCGSTYIWCYVPDAFKVAHVISLLNNDSLEVGQYKNYRPVSNLSFIGKILEKMVAVQLKNHLSCNNLHNGVQSGNKVGHSTETALIK